VNRNRPKIVQQSWIKTVQQNWMCWNKKLPWRSSPEERLVILRPRSTRNYRADSCIGPMQWLYCNGLKEELSSTVGVLGSLRSAAVSAADPTFLAAAPNKCDVASGQTAVTYCINIGSSSSSSSERLTAEARFFIRIVSAIVDTITELIGAETILHVWTRYSSAITRYCICNATNDNSASSYFQLASGY